MKQYVRPIALSVVYETKDVITMSVASEAFVPAPDEVKDALDF